MTNRREFLKKSAILAGATALFGSTPMCRGVKNTAQKNRVVSAAAEDMLIDQKYNPDAVQRAYSAGLQELTDEHSLENAWASLFSPEDVVGIKVNCIGAPKISSSVESIRDISTHVAACAKKGLGTDDLTKIDLRALQV